MTDPARGYADDYRLLWWHQTRRELAAGVAPAAFLAAALLGGLWLTRTATSSVVAEWVIGMCVAGAAAAGLAGRWLLRRIGKAKPTDPPPPRLVRAIVRGEAAVVTHPYRVHPHRGARWLVVLPFLVTGASVVPDPLTETFGPGMIVVWVLLWGAAGSMLTQLWSGLAPPKVALFPDRLEISRLVGRRAVAWPEVQLATVTRDGGVAVYLATGGRIRVEIGTGAREVADAIERYRLDPAARAGIAQHILPRVVDDRPYRYA